MTWLSARDYNNTSFSRLVTPYYSFMEIYLKKERKYLSLKFLRLKMQIFTIVVSSRTQFESEAMFTLFGLPCCRSTTRLSRLRISIVFFAFVIPTQAENLFIQFVTVRVYTLQPHVFYFLSFGVWKSWTWHHHLESPNRRRCVRQSSDYHKNRN